VDESQTHAATTAAGRHSSHLANAHDAVVHQLDHELGQHHVKLAERERQPLADPDPHIGARNPRPTRFHERPLTDRLRRHPAP
jgi:hypothetical protein